MKSKGRKLRAAGKASGASGRTGSGELGGDSAEDGGGAGGREEGGGGFASVQAPARRSVERRIRKRMDKE
jgi:hypothetical protein